MYAIIRTGGKQYTVKPGDIVHVEKLENKLGSEFDISDVLLVGGEKTHVGVPLVKNAKVTVVVTKQAKSRKVIVFKKKRRHSYRKFKTHRQPFTELFVKAISVDDQTAKSDEQPRVMDMAEIRAAKIQAKIDAKRERLDNRGESSSEETVKKPAKKAAAPQKKVAKKAAGAKKSTAKKTKKAGAKKAAKKTSKKA